MSVKGPVPTVEVRTRFADGEPITPTARPLHSQKVWPLPGGSSAPPKGAWAFKSRPDLDPPIVNVTVGAHDTAAGYTFVASKNGPGEDGIGQDGPRVLDDSGHVVWFRPTQGARVRPRQGVERCPPAIDYFHMSNRTSR